MSDPSSSNQNLLLKMSDPSSNNQNLLLNMSDPSSSNQPQQAGSTSDQLSYPKLPPPPTVESDDEDTSNRKMTPTEKLNIIEKILEAPDDPKEMQVAMEKALPSDVIANFRKIQAAIHSDKFPDPVEKEKAKKAFQKLGSLRDNLETKSSKVDKNNAFFFGNDQSRPQPHMEGNLNPYHEAAHRKATPYLQDLFQAVIDDPYVTPEKAPPRMRRAISEIDKINKLIKEKNAKKSLENLGIIRYIDFLGKWRPLRLLDDNDTKIILQKSLLEYCKQMQYPATWANQPPSCDPASGPAEAHPGPQSTSQAVINTDENNYQVPNQNVTNNFAAPSSGMIQQQPYNVGSSNAATAATDQQGSVPQQVFNTQSSSAPQAVMPHNSFTLQGANGQKRVIAIKPRKTHRTVQPGFTSSGEKILFIQSLGESNARFVVTDAEENVRLVSASSAGGPTALEGAKKSGVPSTLQDTAEIQKLRDRVRCGGEYGLEFVAIGEWDTSNKKLPFIVVLFYHQNENGRREVAISRSSLKKILATREAEKLVVESITGNPDISLKEALMAQLSPKGHDGLPSNGNAPLLLPYGGQAPPWWFQHTPQSGSHPALHAGPIQQHYLSQFVPQDIQSAPQQLQQLVPHQFQQPSLQQYHQQSFPHQFQPGPFSMPPQPILDSTMMKHGGNSPAVSLMDEEL